MMSYFHLNANNAGVQLQKGTTKLKTIVVGTTGSAWVIDIYDDTAANASNKVTSITASDGGQYVFDECCVLTRGLFVVASGTTAGDATIIFD